MKRREFSNHLLRASVAVMGGAASAWALAQGEGNGFVVVSPAAPVDAPAGKIEVVEFFSYNCPHCAHFEPELEAWLKKLPADVAFRRVPVPFIGDFEAKQRLYYTLEALGKVEAMQQKVFDAIHQQHVAMSGDKATLAWLGSQPGIDKTKVADVYNSFSVVGKAKRATQLTEAFKLEGVPALGIGGKYLTDGTLAGSMTRALNLSDQLIAQLRKAK
jgi:thiol:disulfide interchange protein DsbA